ncbi:MAG: UvrD-helicase domain-containing protein, partial [Candidatus Poribacteria bacterium]|nr:UvrD-helicase domain-containing protein [Candidatus Poribacteria bacterium]
FYASYLRRIKTSGKQDFDGLLQEAAKQIENGSTVFRRKNGSGDLGKMRHVLIDEYQDFSELFHRLMEAVRRQNPQARFFCVGDDWQAINGFAGSDLRFFQNFAQYFPGSRTTHVTTNYRSGKSIVSVGNALMKGSGKPARAHKTTTGQVVIADLANFKPTPREKREHPGDNFTPAVLRLLNKALASGKTVVLLARKNHLPWYVNYKDREDSSITSGLDRFLAMVRAHLPTEHKPKVTASTVHSYKGLEQDVVIVLDAVPHCFPLLHSELIFTRIFGDNLEKVTAEERRLFYVALTRAVENLFILTETRDVSPFLEDLEKNIRLSKLKWLDYLPLAGETKYFAIRVGNQYGRGPKPTLAIRDLLKAEGYGWDKESKTWYVLRPAEGFSVKDFSNQTSWSDSAAGIEVRFCDDLDNEVAIYNVDHGKWQHISGDIP